MTRGDQTILVLTVAIICFGPQVRTTQAAGEKEQVKADDVLKAIEKGVAFLKRGQGARGEWDSPMSIQFPGGTTALCTLALINAGVEPSDPVIIKALEYLRKIKAKRTYTVALQTMALCAAAPGKDMLIIQHNVRWLEEAQNRKGDRIGAWSYEREGHGGDNSNSQFAVLALYDAQRVGAEIKPATWQRALDYWRNSQNGDGSWGYYPSDPGSGSMTCAGIGGLVTCATALEEGDAQVRDGRIVCCAEAKRDDALEKGLEWLGRNFSVRHNPLMDGSSSQRCLYYYLYGLERTGRLTARRFIGEHDWYREGAEFLVREQSNLKRSWSGNWNAERNENISTSMALLFLAKGRRPVVMAKLKHEPEDDWNQHQKDAANLTTVAEQAWDIDLSWQIYDPESASVEDLVQAPVLYISGSRAPELIPHAKKLRDYVDRGGFLFAEACCADSSKFDRGFRHLIEAVFPESEYKLEQITPSHPIWRMEKLVRPNSPYAGQLWGVEYGCRTCVVYSTEDLSCYWELARPGKWTEYPDPVVKRIQDGLDVGLNVLTYATGREPKGKEQSFVVPLADEGNDALGSRGTIELVKLRHGGGCNDAPGALANLLRIASQGELNLRIRTEAQMINISEDALSDYHLAFMHGRHEFRLTPAEREALGTYLQRGGTLLADAICASKPFVQAFRRELKLALPNNSLQGIPVDDPIFGTDYGGYDVRRVTLRQPDIGREDQPAAARLREVEPQLEGIKIKDRWAVIFSPYDISCALEQHESVQCRGYSRDDATRLWLNVVTYSINL